MSFGIVNITSLKGDSQGALSNLTLNGVRPGDTLYWNLYKEGANGFKLYSDTTKETLIAETDSPSFWGIGVSGPGASFAENPVVTDDTYSKGKFVPVSGILRYDTQASGTSTDLRCVAVGTVSGNPLYVVVGASGLVRTSLTGEPGSWTTQTDGVPSVMFNFVIWVSWLSLFVAVGNTGTIITSPNGVNWTARTSGTTNNLNSIADNGTNLIVVVGAGGTTTRSANATSWTAVTGIYPALAWNSICWTGAAFFVACSEFGGGPMNINSSANGVSWTTNQPTGTDPLSSIIWTGTRVVVAGSNGRILTNAGANSGTWTSRSSGLTGQSLRIFLANGVIYAVSPSGTNTSLMSADGGITWSSGPSYGTAALRFGLSDPSNTSRAILLGDAGAMRFGEYGLNITMYTSDANRTSNTGGIASTTFAWTDTPLEVTVPAVLTLDVEALTPTNVGSGLNFDVGFQALPASNPLSIVAVNGGSVTGTVDVDTSKVVYDDTN